MLTNLKEKIPIIEKVIERNAKVNSEVGGSMKKDGLPIIKTDINNYLL